MEHVIGTLMQTVKLLLLNRVTPEDLLLAQDPAHQAAIQAKMAVAEQLALAVDSDGKDFDSAKLSAVLQQHAQALDKEIVRC